MRHSCAVVGCGTNGVKFSSSFPLCWLHVWEEAVVAGLNVFVYLNWETHDRQ